MKIYLHPGITSLLTVKKIMKKKLICLCRQHLLDITKHMKRNVYLKKLRVRSVTILFNCNQILRIFVITKCIGESVLVCYTSSAVHV